MVGLPDSGNGVSTSKLENFRCEGVYAAADRAIQSFLISREDQEVPIGALERAFDFSRDESLHTEDSYEYRELDAEAPAARSGFSVKGHLYDS